MDRGMIDVIQCGLGGAQSSLNMVQSSVNRANSAGTRSITCRKRKEAGLLAPDVAAPVHDPTITLLSKSTNVYSLCSYCTCISSSRSARIKDLNNPCVAHHVTASYGLLLHPKSATLASMHTA